ncbi:FadR/GntR family transcriptional regulator [Citrobacter braakii]|uniref:FadR/GntR family transcriptional regulator n=2 Tax=Citrobacter TaxID=544 RepID=UPI00066B13F3|nr:FadR/GntR family transcriptional regulator [Citrobacter braakii]HCB1520646.1 FadR family transcriptional regulator [Citrobacter braakii]HCB1526025.1 FadR family transcriptional regulator [Citrobacter braakii]
MKKIILRQDTLSSQVKNYILQLIMKEKLVAGMAVPSEMQLIQDLGVSRGVVREAYRSLAALGILEIQSGKLPTIKKIDTNVLQLIINFAVITEQVTHKDILAVRRHLEMGCVHLAAINGKEEDFEKLREEMRLIKENFKDVDDFISHDLQFHFILSRASGNTLLSILLQSLHEQLMTSMRAGLVAQSKKEKEYEIKIIELHQRICDAVCTRDPERAVQAMAEHFENAIDALID